MPSDFSRKSPPPKDAPSPLTEEREDLFETDLLELFDRYDLPPERIAWLCLYWAEEIFTKLGHNTAEKLSRSREFMAEVNAMTSSSMQIVNNPKSGPVLQTIAYASQRQLMGFRNWTRLEEHVASRKIEPVREPAGDPKVD